MSMSDPIADMLTRIRNAYKAGLKSVAFPCSKLKFGISEVLKKEGYIADFEKKDGETGGAIIEIQLKYPDGRKKVIHEIRRVSKPSRRVYIESKDIKKFKGGLGISIISTSRGILSDRIAKKESVGGELLCTVW